LESGETPSYVQHSKLPHTLSKRVGAVAVRLRLFFNLWSVLYCVTG